MSGKKFVDTVFILEIYSYFDIYLHPICVKITKKTKTFDGF